MQNEAFSCILLPERDGLREGSRSARRRNSKRIGIQEDRRMLTGRSQRERDAIEVSREPFSASANSKSQSVPSL